MAARDQLTLGVTGLTCSAVQFGSAHDVLRTRLKSTAT